MRVIDLLNKIANEEIKEISKFIYNGELYEQESNFEKFDNRKGYCCIRKNGITLTTLDTLFDIHKLNDEVEIIEEDKKIEKIDFRTLNTQKEKNRVMKDTINQIIDKLNEMSDDV